LARLGVAGVILIDVSVAVVTVSAVLPDTAPSVAIMVVLPAERALTRPLVPAALLVVATAVFDDDHVTVVVRSFAVASEYVPVAMNCCCNPLATLALAGVTPIETSTAEVTFMETLAEAPWKVATIVAAPDEEAVTTPAELPPEVTAATVALDELQAA
jgi:hypothetical protein